MSQDITIAQPRFADRLLPMALRDLLARVARRRRNRPTRPSEIAFQQTLATALVQDLSRRLGTPCDLVNFHATRTGSLTVRARADRSYVAKLPLHASTEARLRQNAQALQTFGQSSWLTPFLSARCPALIALGTASEYFYSAETALPGQDGATLLKARGNADELVLSAQRFLVRLEKASLKPAPVGPPRWDDRFASEVERVAHLARRVGETEAYRDLVSFLRIRLAAQPVPSVYAHGNFWLGNVLFDASCDVSGVIDWDCATPAGLPAVDLLYLLVRTHSLVRNTSYGDAVVDWIEADSLPLLDDCAARHFAELRIPVSLIAPLTYCSWIQHLDAHCRFGTSTTSDSRWLDRNVRHVLHGWQSRTSNGRLSTNRWRR
jgi:aminoglycoside phosphotransferase (APT) family kinase protein